MLTLTLVAAAVSLTVPAGADRCLSGVVLDSGGRPIANAAVSLVAQASLAAPLKTLSDRAGSFQLSGLTSERYWLVAERLGFEPALSAVEFAAATSSDFEIRLSPLGALLRREGGRSELPWLVRASGGDPTRLAEPTATGTTDTAPSAKNRAVQGRVGWNALAGDAAKSSELGATGNRAQIELEGALRPDVTWFVDGRVDAIDGVDASRDAAAGGSQAVRYGMDYGKADGGLRFSGELKRATRGGPDEASPGDTGERRASYALVWRSGDPTDEALDVGVGYRAAVAEGGAVDADGSHAIVEGHGEYGLRLSNNKLLRSRFSVRAQRWSSPNRTLLAESAPQGGMLRDGRFLNPREWEFDLNESFEWQLAGALRVLPGVDVSRGSGEHGVPFLRPRMGADLALGQRTRLRADLSWAFDGDAAIHSQTAHRGVAGALGARFGLEQQLGAGGYLRIVALRNGFRDLDHPQMGGDGHQDYLLFARGEVSSHELRLDLRTPAVAGLAGYMTLAVGGADGDLSFVPLAYARPGGTTIALGDDGVRFASTVVGGSFSQTSTELLVRYRVLDTQSPNGDYARVDIELEQGLPWCEFLGTQLDLMIAISDFMRLPGYAANPSGALPFEPAPVLAAGVGVRF